MDIETVKALEEQKNAAMRDLEAHRRAHKGPLGHTIPCYMDNLGTCHGIGEDIARRADEAIHAYHGALGELHHA